MIRLGLIWAVLAVLGAASPVLAHSQNRSYSTWAQDGPSVTGLFSIAARDATRLKAPDGDLHAAVIAHLRETVAVSSGGDACALKSAVASKAARPDDVAVILRYACPEGGGERALTLRSGAFLTVAMGHVHYARMRLAGGGWSEHVLSWSKQNASLTTPESEAPSAFGLFADYVWLGVIHILVGLDHLAFLIALMLLCPRWRTRLWVVTGFTLGHSLTLALAVTGAVTAREAAIEALIGFTIAVAAVESMTARDGTSLRAGLIAAAALAGLALAGVFVVTQLPALVWIGLIVFAAAYGAFSKSVGDPARFAAALAAVFGLIHGFGFAGVLMEIGLPQDHLLFGLVGFNIGVELGQIAFILAAGGVAAAVGALLPDGPRRLAPPVTASLLTGLGIFWFVGRAFGV